MENIKRHPEQGEDEIYLGNSTNNGFMASAWKTKRMGLKALDVNGKDISSEDFKPWFIKRSEVEESIKELKKGHKPAKRSIRIYQKMLDNKRI